MSARGIAAAVLVLAGVGVTGMIGWAAATGWHPPTGRYAFQGVDVSAEQATIDWPAVAAQGTSFAYVVATDGATRRDPRFEANWQGAREAGLRRGAIHLYSLCQGAAEQADAFNVVVPKVPDALPAAVAIAFSDDCPGRPGRAAMVADLGRFLTAVETHTGKPALLKLTRPVERAYHLSAALHRPVWETAAFLKPDYAARPWRMWQASPWRRLPGIDGPVHWDVVAP